MVLFRLFSNLYHRTFVLVPFSSNAKASEDESMMDLKTFLGFLLTKEDLRFVHDCRELCSKSEFSVQPGGFCSEVHQFRPIHKPFVG
jgi:hypothetical protein